MVGFLSELKRSKFQNLKKVQQTKLHQLNEVYKSSDAKLKFEINSARRKEGVTIVQNLFTRLSDAAFRDIRFDTKKMEITNLQSVREGALHLEKLLFKRKTDYFKKLVI